MDAIPQYIKIAQILARPIDSGSLKPGDKLPSVRTVAREQGVSLMTAVQAIHWLEDSGRVCAKPRSGFYVCARKDLDEGTSNPPLEVVELDSQESLHLSIVGSPCRVRLDLANGDTSLYPIEKLSILMRQLIYRSPHLLGDAIHDHMGYEPLRHQIARRALNYGCTLDSREIIVTNGCIEALALAVRAVTRPDDAIAVESPTYFVILQMLHNLGRKIVQVPVNADGMDLDVLRCILQERKIKAVITIANANNPTGSITSDDHKRELAALAERHDFQLIEDDIYGDTHFSDVRLKPVRAFSDKVILCSSFSKTLAPGIRVGWVAGGKWTPAIAALKYTSTMGTPIYPQATIAEFLRSGAYDAHLRKLRQTLRLQIDRMRQLILQSFPSNTEVSNPQGGYVLWVKLHDHSVNTQHLFELAREEGIGIAPGHLFGENGQFDDCFRLNGGVVWNHDVENAIMKLAYLTSPADSRNQMSS